MLTGLLLDQIWSEPEQVIQTGSGSVLHSILWKNGTESDTGSQIQLIGFGLILAITKMLLNLILHVYWERSPVY